MLDPHRTLYLLELMYADTKWKFDLSSSFICDNCLKKSGKSRKENKFSARRKLHMIVKQQ